MNIIDYQNVDISGVIDRLPPAERNALPFGCVMLDKSGVILEYNMAEASISGVEQKDVIGKNFFLDVAVCTQRPEFYGLFRQAMDSTGFINSIFNYEFQNALYAAVHEPVKVRVHMFSSQDPKGKPVVWLIVKRIDTSQPSVIDVKSKATAKTAASANNKSSPGQSKGDLMIEMDL